jgi:hypothetical protein
MNNVPPLLRVPPAKAFHLNANPAQSAGCLLDQYLQAAVRKKERLVMVKKHTHGEKRTVASFFHRKKSPAARSKCPELVGPGPALGLLAIRVRLGLRGIVPGFEKFSGTKAADAAILVEGNPNTCGAADSATAQINYAAVAAGTLLNRS